jgi:hypothetical protein
MPIMMCSFCEDVKYLYNQESAKRAYKYFKKHEIECKKEQGIEDR